jgi:predicted AAA+ superfamily ATPase
VINYNKIANDVGVSAPTIREYYQILEDTLIGFLLPAWKDSQKRKAASTHKFYLFDLGITHFLNEVEHLERASDLYGRAFEHWIALELRAYLSYRRIKQTLSFWRTYQGCEVDFLIGHACAIEVKSTQRVSTNDLKGLKALSEEGVFKKFYLVSHDPIGQVVEAITCLPWQQFIEKLWADQII